MVVYKIIKIHVQCSTFLEGRQVRPHQIVVIIVLRYGEVPHLRLREYLRTNNEEDLHQKILVKDIQH